MIQLLTFIGKRKWGKLTCILILGLFLQSFSQTYGSYTEAWNTTPHDTTFLLRGTNQMYNRDGAGVLQPSIIVNPLRHMPYWLIGNWPANFDSATMQAKITQAQGDARYYPLSSNPSSYLTSVPAQSFASLTGKPTTLSGYGITDATSNARAAISVTGSGISYNSSTGLITSTAGGGTVTSVGITNGTGISVSGSPVTTSGNITVTNTAPDQTVVLTGSNGIGITGTYPSFGINNNRTFSNNVARTLNSNYTISSTRDAVVSYSISLSCTNPLLAGSSAANAFLEYSTDGGSNWIIVSQATNSSSVALAVTIALTQPNTFVLSGMIPANGLTRIRTTTSGTASATYTRGQEVY